MEYRHLGNSGLKVSVLSLGGWVTFGGQVDEDVTYECMKAAYEAGVNFFDCAEVYADGKSEEEMGKVIKRCGWKRSDLVISTKIFWGGKGPNDRGLSRKHIVEGLDAALKRLGTAYVDLIYAHRPDVDTPMEETVRAFNHVIDQGKAFYWGTSEWSAVQIMEAHMVAERLGLIGPLMEQPQYNMFHRERVEKEYEPLFRRYGMGLTIWSPLASGLLTGKYNEGIPEGTRLTITDMPVMVRQRNALLSAEGQEKIGRVRGLAPIATELGCTLAQLALAWCLRNPRVSTVITGASRASQVHENMKALAVVPLLTEEVVGKIEAVLENAPVLEFNYRLA